MLKKDQPAALVQTSQKKIRPHTHRDETLTGWFMAAPAILLVMLFLITPFFMSVVLSFTNQRLISPNPTEFVGLRNFSRLLTLRTLTLEPVRDSIGSIQYNEEGEVLYPSIRSYTRNNPDYPKLDGLRELATWHFGETRLVFLASDVVFYKALLNTFLFVLAIVPLQGGFALLLALLLNRRLRGITVFRSIFFTPVVISMVIVSLLWRFIYDGDSGLLNAMLNAITFGNFKPISWLGDTKTALFSVIVMSTWQGVGFHMVIWLAGLQNIPGALYEAASIDGANAWQKLRNITLPGLRNTAIFVFVIITMQAFGLYVQIEVMTRGGPLDSTQSLIFQAVQRGYGKQDIAGGSALSLIFFLLVFSITLTQRILTREKRS